MNTTSKGNRRQNSARKKLESEGWWVYVARRGFMGQPIDIFLWDIIAYKDGYFRLIQVKSNKCPKQVRERLEAFKVDGIIVRTEIWVYVDYVRSGPEITILCNRPLQ